MKEHQGLMTNEFQPIKQKYFLHEKVQLKQDPFVESLQEYFQIFRRRIILHIFLSFFFLALIIPSIILQADYIELDVSKNGTKFRMEQTWDPPISIYVFSKTDILLLDVQLFLDEKEITEFTIYERLYINTQYNLTSNTTYSFSSSQIDGIVQLCTHVLFDYRSCNASHLPFVLYPYIHSLQKTLIFYCVQFLLLFQVNHTLFYSINSIYTQQYYSFAQISFNSFLIIFVFFCYFISLLISDLNQLSKYISIKFIVHIILLLNVIKEQNEAVQDKQQIYIYMQQQAEELDQFIQTLNNQSTIPFLQQALTQDQLLAQNARLLQQLHEQQRMLNLQSFLTQSVLQNPFINQQITQESKKIKKTKSTLQRIQSNASIKEQAPLLQEIKGNVKNAYIKKITSLLSVEGEKLLDEELQEDLQGDSSSEEVSKEQKFGLAGLLGSGNDLLSAESRNKRLRKSAKNSRLRKKVYLKLLEKKVSDLDQKIQEYKKTTRQSFEYLTQILSSHPILNSMIIGNSNAFDQIKQCNQSDQAQLLLDSYLMRYGTCGIKRRDYLKYAVKNIQRNFLKGNYGLQLISLNHEVKNYDEEFNNYVEIVKKLTKLEDENLIYKVLPIIDKLLNHRKISQQLLLKLNTEMKKLKLIQSEVEETVNQFTQQISPIQQLELVKNVEKLATFNRSLK
ncbi:unnamed protein product [Paramecium sonneborni]|uniref:Transmembrane protein n=1 Tax=Paramecium sonneborni TaxID=65129 RepID=A0A8S1QA13_9CILI|nr:unnamed protein product [Paramecium sonneborni]